MEEVRELIWSDQRLTVRKIAEKGHISYGSVQSILTEKFGMRHVCAKLVPRILTSDQKAEHVAIATEMLRQSTKDPTFMSSIVAEDESWVYGYRLYFLYR